MIVAEPACDSTKQTRPWCTGWGDPASPVHGCGRSPGHGGDHVCPCGATWPRRTRSIIAKVHYRNPGYVAATCGMRPDASATTQTHADVTCLRCDKAIARFPTLHPDDGD